MSQKKQSPDFDRMSDEEFAAFWETHSFADYWEEFEHVKEPVFVRQPKKVVALRLEREVVDLLEILAREKGLSYTALIRMWIFEQLRRELAERRREKTDSKA
jgi:uncharacterized protein (DUF4415 family)